MPDRLRNELVAIPNFPRYIAPGVQIGLLATTIHLCSR